MATCCWEHLSLHATRESYLQDIDMCPIPCTAAPGPQDAQATHGLFNSCSDHQDGGTFELIESPSHYTHSSLLELGFSEFEEQFPDMCAMVEPMSPSTCGHVDAGNTLSDPEAAHMQSSSSQDTQQGHSEELYSLQMMTGRYVSNFRRLDAVGFADWKVLFANLLPGARSEPQEEAYVQAQEGSQTSSSASNLYSDYQGTFDCITVSDGYTDQSGAEPRQEENEDEDGVQDDPGQATQTVEHSVPDPGNVGTNETAADTTTAASTRCWDHGCNGRQFSTRSNLLRHQIEKGKARPNFKCPTCGAFFSRTTARNQHVAKNSCNRVRRYSNGRERPGPRVVDKS